MTGVLSGREDVFKSPGEAAPPASKEGVIAQHDWV